MCYNDDVKVIKRNILDIAYKAQEGHLPSSFSITDILYVLYKDILRVDPQNTSKEDRDYLVVSKGHAAIGIYAVLAFFGFFTYNELADLGKYGSKFGGHPDYNKVPGVEASTGSLGHGFPMAVGMAMGLKIKKSKQKVYCILGDGEANEGSVWEAIILAAQLNLNNMVCVFDNNKSIQRSIDWGDLEIKLNAFGWNTTKVNGHDHDALKNALSVDSEKPYMIIAETIKGVGCKTMEADPSAWHHRTITKQDYEMFLKELGQ